MTLDLDYSDHFQTHDPQMMLRTAFESFESPQNFLLSWQNSVKLFLQLSSLCILLVHIQYLVQVLIYYP